jgi:hypothetical protein
LPSHCAGCRLGPEYLTPPRCRAAMDGHLQSFYANLAGMDRWSPQAGDAFFGGESPCRVRLGRCFFVRVFAFIEAQLFLGHSAGHTAGGALPERLGQAGVLQQTMAPWVDFQSLGDLLLPSDPPPLTCRRVCHLQGLRMEHRVRLKQNMLVSGQPLVQPWLLPIGSVCNAYSCPRRAGPDCQTYEGLVLNTVRFCNTLAPRVAWRSDDAGAWSGSCSYCLSSWHFCPEVVEFQKFGLCGVVRSFAERIRWHSIPRTVISWPMVANHSCWEEDLYWTLQCGTWEH